MRLGRKGATQGHHALIYFYFYGGTRDTDKT